jgi:hypothetical protein
MVRRVAIAIAAISVIPPSATNSTTSSLIEVSNQSEVGDVRTDDVAEGDCTLIAKPRADTDDQLGDEVPYATTVSPMMSCLMPKERASPAAPPTNHFSSQRSTSSASVRRGTVTDFEVAAIHITPGRQGITRSRLLSRAPGS